MRALFAGLGLATVLAAGFAGPAAAQSTPPAAKVQVGILACTVDPSMGFVLGSIREMQCELRSAKTQPYTVKGGYKGTVARFGIDIGVITGGKLIWGVFAPSVNVSYTDLAGTYVGVTADVAWAIGGGANVLLGGSSQSIALQPLSVEGMTGADIAAGVADMKLVALPMPAPAMPAPK